MSGGDLLNVSVSGLNLSQTALRTAGHNIANANTEGYTRQSVLSSANPALYTGAGFLGNGVEVSNITRQANEFVINQWRTDTALFNQQQTYLDAAEQLDNVLANPSLGLSDALSHSPRRRAFIQGGAFDVGVVFPNFDASAKDYQFIVTINGVTSSVLAIPQKVYASEDELALEIQALINADGNLSSANVAVDVSMVGGVLSLESRAYGSKSTVAISTDDGVDSIAELGLTVGSGVAGIDVAGTIDGVVAFGLGNVLLPELDSDPYGMKLTVAEGATGASSVTFSRGFGGTMFQLIDAMITNNGLISNREANIERDLERLDDEQARLDRRIEAYNARLLAQHSAMDAIVQSLNTTRDYLSNILKTLPYTSSDN